jgi:type II secretory pathway pseudopilin PulG
MLIALILPMEQCHDLKMDFFTLGVLCGIAGIFGGISLFFAAVLSEIDKKLFFSILAILFFGFVSVFILPNLGTFSGIRAKIARVRADFKYLAEALERYHNDNHKYPPWARGEEGVNGFAGEGTNAYRMHTFAKNALTSPIKYIESYPQDPFSDERWTTYGYYTDGGGFILYSWGPDTDENDAKSWDLEADIEKVYNSKIAQPSFTLLTGKSSAPKGGAYTYDPSNGTVSQGDIYWVKH